jgi:NADH-quinone oxidoreductase subunit M
MKPGYLLLTIILLPFKGCLNLLPMSSIEEDDLKVTSLLWACLTLICALLLWLFLINAETGLQFSIHLLWADFKQIPLGLDGISVFFILLTTLLTPLCLLASWNSITHNIKEFLLLFLILEFLLITSFLVLDILIFYMLFESTLIPMFLMIGIWGSRERKILASYYFFIYTLFGSILMLVSLIYLRVEVLSTHYELLIAYPLTVEEQKYIWITFFLAFASKVPMIPVHLWLPEAHVEAPTAGSVMLAGILLKLGTYGLIRFTLPICSTACFFFTPLVYTLASVGIILTSFTSIRQSDFKRIIAYTSIAHMNLVVLGIFSYNIIGVEGAILQSLSHGFVSSGLFLLIGVVYDRYHTRIVHYYGGLATIMPVYVGSFLFFTLANISFPGTSSFIGELLILIGSFKVNNIVTLLGATGVIICSVYSLWLFNRISYGNLKTQYTKTFLDLTLKELLILMPLMICTIIVGIKPNIVLCTIHTSVNNLIETIYF